MSEQDPDRNVLRDDLSADQATQGLSEAEREQLQKLPGGNPLHAEDLELTAAAIQLAVMMPNEPLPATLKQKVTTQAKSFFRERQSPPNEILPTVVPRPALSWVSWAGWAVAAAILLAVAAKDYTGRTNAVSSMKLRQELLAHAGTVRLEWSATEDPSAVGLTGDVVWNEREQRGYMTFHRLAKNDPQVSTYQLWIFAGNQDERYPADGGVFDIPAGDGDVIVLITPRVRVSGAKLFAVTVERPGGVVVSKRERIVSVAKVS